MVSLESDGLGLYLLSKFMDDAYDPTLSEWCPHSKTTLVIFSAFLLEDYDLLTVTDGLDNGLDMGWTHIGTADQGVGAGTD